MSSHILDNLQLLLPNPCNLSLNLTSLIITFSFVLPVWGAGRRCCAISSCLQSLQLFRNFGQLDIQLMISHRYPTKRSGPYTGLKPKLSSPKPSVGITKALQNSRKFLIAELNQKVAIIDSKPLSAVIRVSSSRLDLAVITKPLFTLCLCFFIIAFSCVLTIWGAGRTCCAIRRLGVVCVQGCLQSLQLFGHFRQLHIQLLQLQSQM